MKDNMKKLTGALGIAALVLAASVCYFFITRDTDDKPALNITRQETGRSQPLPAQNDAFIDQMVGQLKKYYGKTISEKSTQASLIGIRDYILGTYPANGKALFYTILTRAFPDYAHEILETLGKMDQYNLWLDDNKKMLVRMTATERAAALWAKRRELFGDDAEKIWSGEMLATETRKLKVQDTLAVLNKSDDTTIDEKLDVYQGTLRDTYKGSPEEFILDQNYILSKVFFSIDSVQNELKQLSPDQRQMEINDIRRKMGFPEDQIEALAKRDADNERRWEVGLKYMQKREEIVQESEEPERGEKLKSLREQYFQDEAKTIELEEKDNFFRFKRPHIYGRN